MFRKDLIEVITDTGLVTLKRLRPLTLDKAPDIVSELGLLELEGFDEIKFAQIASKRFQVSFIDLSNANISQDVLQSITKKHATEYRVVPVQKNPKMLTLVTFDPTILDIKDQLRKALKFPIDVVLTTVSGWKKLYERMSVSVEELAESVVEVAVNAVVEEKIEEKDIGEDIVIYVNRIMAEAYAKGASDIHLEPYEKRFRVRIRVDGELLEIDSPPKNLMLPILSRVKIMAQMDIAERRKPQDGRIKLSIGGHVVDYRVSSLPTLFGEKIVLRLLDSSSLELDMTKLGFETSQIKTFQEGIMKPFGMVLVTGPTGSGKTTTLYSALAELNKVHSNISTVEDPVEFNLEGINQVNVKKDIGLNFAVALKAFLRQDPDIIMVGEIRDFETGEIAVEAALTGHLVLSTLHTNDASSTITRLLNMGIEPFLVVASLNVVVAQRLCRKICPHCKEQQNVSVAELVACGIAPQSAERIKVYRGRGCPSCSNTGYKGRIAIYEVLNVTTRVKDLIIKNASADDIKRMAIKEGMKTLRMSALTKVAQGLTTIEEAVSVSSSDTL